MASSRTARFTAETIAFSDEVTIEGSMPAPHKMRSPTAHSRYEAAMASPPAPHRMLVVVQYPNIHAVAGQCGAEGGDRAVADAVKVVFGAVVV